MAQFHKIAAMSMAMALASGNALALGLGEISWKSSLNEPLNAEIALYDLRNISDREIFVKLADSDAFEKAGIDQSYILSDLTFTPVIKNGKGFIQISSKKPVKEPYIDFLLSVTWSSGETLREYTLLIDPRTYTPVTVIPVSSSKSIADTNVKTTKKTVIKKSTPVVDTTKQTTSSSPAKKSKVNSRNIAAGNAVKVVGGDNLWNIALHARGNTSIHQAMLAIYQENADAFINGDMSLLKKGVVLRIPSLEQMRTQSRSEALAQVTQNINTKGASARQIAVSKDSTPKASTPAVLRDELKIVASTATIDSTATNNGSGVADTNNGSAGKSTLADISTKVVLAQENLDATLRKNEDLRSRINELESRLTDMRALIQLKDNRLAALQANMIKAQKGAAEAAMPVDKVQDPQVNTGADTTVQ